MREKEKRKYRTRPNGAELVRSNKYQIPYDILSFIKGIVFTAKRKKRPSD